jgi:predicted nucleotidyltransferase
MNTVENEIIREFKQRLRERIGPCRLVLFGSRARGDAQADSDMDILVELDQPVDDRIRSQVSECAWEACFAKGIYLSALPVYRKEWETGIDSVSMLAGNVCRDGLEL